MHNKICPAKTHFRGTQTTDKARFKKWKTGYKPEQERKGGGHEPLDVLNSGGQEGLFAHIPDSEHASIAQTMVDLGLRKGAFNCLFSPAVDAPALLRFGKGNDVIQGILPDMSLHHPSRHTCSKALCPSWADLTGFAVTEVLAIALAGGGFPVEMLVLRADVSIKVRVVFEAIFAVGRCLVGVPPVANDTLDSFLFQQMGDPGIVVSGIQSHVLRQFSQPHLDLVENFGERGDVVKIGRLDVDVDDHVALAVYRPVFAVMEAVRFAFLVQLAAFRVAFADLPSRRAIIVILLVEGLLARFLAPIPELTDRNVNMERKGAERKMSSLTF